MTPAPLRVAVFGASGRMGRAVVDAVRETADLVLVAAVTARPDAHEARAGVQLVAELPADARPDVLVDVTAPAATGRICHVAATLGAALVVGATGLSGSDEAALREAAGRVAVLRAPNLSVGVALLYRLVREAARVFAGHVEIVEVHHAAKRDAPSGTALALAGEIERAKGSVRHLEHGREGASLRSDDEIGIHAVRGGDVAGEHHVLFLGDGERLELVHRASSRRAFALGAVRAIRFAVRSTPGMYGMDDVMDAKAREAEA